jgi:hypothetical protein
MHYQQSNHIKNDSVPKRGVSYYYFYQINLKIQNLFFQNF